jgi:hypothetical protein
MILIPGRDEKDTSSGLILDAVGDGAEQHLKRKRRSGVPANPSLNKHDFGNC